MGIIIEHRLLPNTGRRAPWVRCWLEAGEHFLMRIDTGADISVVPRTVLSHHVFPVRHLYTRGHLGDVQRSSVYKCRLNIEGMDFDAEVITTEADIGLLGMDFLKDYDVRLCGGITTIDER